MTAVKRRYDPWCGRAGLGQDEPLVSVAGHGFAFLHIGREAADIRHKDARLTRHIGADIPGAAGRAVVGTERLGSRCQALQKEHLDSRAT